MTYSRIAGGEATLFLRAQERPRAHGPGWSHGLRCLMALCCLAAVTGAIPGASAQDVLFPQTLRVFGGLGPDKFQAPFYVTWQSLLHVDGENWRPNSNLTLHFRGPLNNPSVPPVDRVLGILQTDAFGSIMDVFGEGEGAAFRIPYDRGITGNLGRDLPDIFCPGLYQVYAVLDHPFIAQVAGARGPVHLLALTEPFFFGPTFERDYVDWGRSRGLRDGFLGDHSPEYLDPEWVSVWSRRPVEMYGTVAETNADGNNQPMQIAHHEAPGSHYAHDANLHILPDPEYRWVLGSANLRGDPASRGTGRIELEWEIQNDYSPNAYHRGVVGMPLWVHGSVGDRVYTVGSWVMDGGHRGSGFRTEIHPPRLLATMRAHHTVVPLDSPDCLIPASQVDVFVSGHGGGVNHYYDGLEDLLDNRGKGGGRLEDFMRIVDHHGPIYDFYYRYGAGSGALVDALAFWGTTQDVYSHAGPSAIGTDLLTRLPTVWDYSQPPPVNVRPWVLGPEERPINDMDYDFDVPLPPPPPGATAPRVHVETRPEHSTQVQEVITFTDVSETTGLPTKARVHLPYRGADNGVYARTYKFSWNVYSWPGRHYRVKIDEITFFLPPNGPLTLPWNEFTGKERMWANVCGQWVSLTDLRPDFFLNGVVGKASVGFGDDAIFDVYLDDGEQLEVYTYGYERCSLENKYVQDIGKGAYAQAVSILDELVNGSGDNKKLGGAFFRRFSNPLPKGVAGGIAGQHFVNGGASSSGFEDYSSGYFITFTISYVPNPHAEVTPAAVDFGQVALGSTVERVVRVKNRADQLGQGGFSFDVLTCQVSLDGEGYSFTPAAFFGVGAGEYVDLTVRFAPTRPGQGAGTLTIETDDPCSGTIRVPLGATVLYPEISVSPNDVEFGPTVLGCATSRTVTVANTGTADLLVSPSLAGAGYSYALPEGTRALTVAPGASVPLTVNFSPTALTRRAEGTLTLRSNDPFNPIKPVSLCAEAVPVGIRVLALRADGSPYPSVDQMTLSGVPGAAKNRKDLALTTIGPPQSCKPIRFHLEMALPTSDASGQNGGQYRLLIRVGNRHQRVEFTLGPCDFREIVVTLP